MTSDTQPHARAWGCPSFLRGGGSLMGADLCLAPCGQGPRIARHLDPALGSIWQSWCACATGDETNAGERRMACWNAAKSTARSVRDRVAIYACLVTLATTLPSPSMADGRGPVKSLLEIRQNRVVVQQW